MGLAWSFRTARQASTAASVAKDFLKSNPELFFDVMQKLRVDHVMPTLTHFFMRLLQARVSECQLGRSVTDDGLSHAAAPLSRARLLRSWLLGSYHTSMKHPKVCTCFPGC